MKIIGFGEVNSPGKERREQIPTPDYVQIPVGVKITVEINDELDPYMDVNNIRDGIQREINDASTRFAMGVGVAYKDSHRQREQEKRIAEHRERMRGTNPPAQIVVAGSDESYTVEEGGKLRQNPKPKPDAK